MIYVLIALALFGALTLTLSSQNEQADGQDISDEQAEFYATELIEYAASVKNVIDQMIAIGTDIDELDFINPTNAAFNTPPHIHKVYHPQGGGLNYVEDFPSDLQISGTSAWYRISSTNVEWTPTTESDVVLSAIRIPENVCRKINVKILGTSNIPALDDFLSPYLTTGVTDFNIINCPECEGYPSLCVVSNPVGNYGFYNIIAAQ